MFCSSLYRSSSSSLSLLQHTDRRNGQVVLGRLVVHDRIEVEAKVLPRYFNHSSFASLRRQLNYFNFTRVGRGRQRDSTYINDGVVELEDIMTLRRRPVGTATGGQQAATTAITNHHHHHSQGRQETTTTTTPRQQAKVVKEKIVAQQQPTTSPLVTKKTYVESIVPVVHLPLSTVMRSSSSKSMAAKRAKRNSVGHKQQQHKKLKNNKLTLPRVSTPPFVSEDEESHHHQEKKQQHVALDLTVPPPTDPELLEGCTALLGLSGKLFLG